MCLLRKGTLLEEILYGGLGGRTLSLKQEFM